MSEHSRSGKRPDSKTGNRSKSGGTSGGSSRSGGSRSSSRPSHGGARSGGGSSFSSSGRSSAPQGRGRQQARPVIKYDPSMFMKKVEEQVASHAYVPKNMFADFVIEPVLKDNIIKKGYVSPTPIQDQAIPLLLEGLDVIGTANTGTGKTAAFLIPLINNILTKKTSRVLVIAPTRELADQIQAEFKSFAVGTGLMSVLCIGGSNLFAQIKALKNNPEFVIGTPGRLIDLEEQGVINFHNYTSIVLDEVDRMLDMGFIVDIKRIMGKLPRKRHSLFFSATMPKTLVNTMSGFLNDPVSISVKTRQSAENVNQEVIKVGSSNKIEMLHDLLIKPDFKKVIIFLRTKRSVDKLAKILMERGFTVVVMHGDKSQPQRNKALAMFKTDAVKILLATDVVARGIDIDDVTHVINFDLPQTYEDYIHRIGRTGRADKVGQAITFVD